MNPKGGDIMYMLYGIFVLLTLGEARVFFAGIVAPDGMVEFGQEMRHWEDILQDELQIQMVLVMLIVLLKIFGRFGTVPEGTPFTKTFLLHFLFGIVIANVFNTLFAIKGGLWEMQEIFGFSMLGIYWLVTLVLISLCFGWKAYAVHKQLWDAAEKAG